MIEGIRMAVLGSGSKGNSAVVECGGSRLLVDAGLSAKQLTSRLSLLGIAPESLDGILISHEHGDHVRGLKVLLKNWNLPVYCTAMTGRVVREAGIAEGRWKCFDAGQAFQIGGAAVHTFSLQHDAVDPVGFVIGDGSRRIGVVTDAGDVTRNLTEALRGVEGLFIEANYDDDLLANDTKRPWSIKQRISSRHGHLSNRQCAGLLREIAHERLTRVVIGHLSSDCNTPETALHVLRSSLAEAGHPQVALHCAGQDEPTGWLSI
jgi:phosphoribosyl 1,2-cyclic phosphodiesterase